jgi:hypothetical protein
VDGHSSAIRLLRTHLMALVPDEIADIGKLAAQLLPRAERVSVSAGAKCRLSRSRRRPWKR